MFESELERKFVKAVHDIGGWALKFTAAGTAGVPDRIVLLPGGRCFFVELKAPGRKMRPLQLKRAQQLEKLGFKVYCVDSTEKITEVLDTC